MRNSINPNKFMTMRKKSTENAWKSKRKEK